MANRSSELVHDSKLEKQGEAKMDSKQEPKPFVLVVVGPMLRYLAAQKQLRMEREGSTEVGPLPVWPFAVAGASLFGLGLVGGYAFMSGNVKEDNLEKERLRQLMLSEKEIAHNRKLAFRTALASLGLGTLLACTGAALAVKITSYYLDVHSASEFAEYMRRSLPVRKAGWTESFQETSIAKFAKQREQKYLARASATDPAAAEEVPAWAAELTSAVEDDAAAAGARDPDAARAAAQAKAAAADPAAARRKH